MKSPHTCYLGVSGQSDDVGEFWLMNFQALKAGNAAPYSNKDKACSPHVSVGSIPQLQKRSQRGFPSLWGRGRRREREGES